MAFDEIEPFGDYRADLRNAMLCCLIHGAFRGKDQEPARIKDFLIGLRRQEAESSEDGQTQAQIGAKLMEIFGQFKKQKERKGGKSKHTSG